MTSEITTRSHAAWAGVLREHHETPAQVISTALGTSKRKSLAILEGRSPVTCEHARQVLEHVGLRTINTSKDSFMPLVDIQTSTDIQELAREVRRLAVATGMGVSASMMEPGEPLHLLRDLAHSLRELEDAKARISHGLNMLENFFDTVISTATPTSGEEKTLEASYMAVRESYVAVRDALEGKRQR